MLRFISYLLLFAFLYFVIKFIVQILFPIASNKKSNTFYKHYSSNKKEGEITIDHIPKKEKKINKDEGKYVDYKDID